VPEIPMNLETLIVHKDGAVLFVDISAPPMNLLGPELVRDLVSLIQKAEAESAIKVLVFKSADPDYFIAHVDLPGNCCVFCSYGSIPCPPMRADAGCRSY
jgi:enoyl-CoA hydratase/carnithine racemase